MAVELPQLLPCKRDITENSKQSTKSTPDKRPLLDRDDEGADVHGAQLNSHGIVFRIESTHARHQRSLAVLHKDRRISDPHEQVAGGAEGANVSPASASPLQPQAT